MPSPMTASPKTHRIHLRSQTTRGVIGRDWRRAASICVLEGRVAIHVHHAAIDEKRWGAGDPKLPRPFV